MTTEEFMKSFTRRRKAHKNKWMWTKETVNGTTVDVKSYNTWIQIIQFNGMRDSGPMDCSVKDLNEYLLGMIKRTERSAAACE